MRLVKETGRIKRFRERTPLRSRDKASTWTRRMAERSYTCPVHRTTPDLAGFQSWVKRVLDHLKETRGWGISRVATAAGIARSRLTDWRDGNWSRGAPKQATVENFCTSLGLPFNEPFAYFGWDPAGRPA